MATLRILLVVFFYREMRGVGGACMKQVLAGSASHAGGPRAWVVPQHATWLWRGHHTFHAIWDRPFTQYAELLRSVLGANVPNKK
jgi:hypothetical protein